ncbi:hypothetical protein [Desulfohalobium retbaense]|uniref:Uncharacterized protein n=1 Tax=Desulfohalobium retbaense (strain ATCC 49708 / DSM 5692 / JCM 16813 / HR100) TaxID=485915 RepID=C8X5N0_DESRD|nr:hypothetical protein [Desulfohalobium retbaense]ACV69727.1 conserved hypothetical protein [Desulfohalobium retbaense DSM 5692]
MKRFMSVVLGCAMLLCFGTSANAQGHPAIIAGLVADAELSGNLDLTLQLMAEANIGVYFAMVDADVAIDGDIDVDGVTRSLAKNDQFLMINSVNNYEVDNTATVSGEVLKGAAGNIGVNIAAGDFNAQSQVVAVAASEQERSMAEAKSFSVQKAMFNSACNEGVTNKALAKGDALMGVSGNIGLNIAAGNHNGQTNMFAATVAPSRVSVATAYVQQKNMHNTVGNMPLVEEYVENVPVNLGLNAGGTAGSTNQIGFYGGDTQGSFNGETSGMSYQASNFYPDVWARNPNFPIDEQHPNSPEHLGHVDFDAATQGAIDNPNREGVGGMAFDNEGTVEGDYEGTESGMFMGGIGSQQIQLTGTVTGDIPVVVTRYVGATNTATLSNRVLMNAEGNVGVNVAAGTNNLQANSLSVSYVPAANGNIPTPGNGGGGEQ